MANTSQRSRARIADNTTGRADRRRVDAMSNQAQRAVAGVGLMVDALPPRTRVIVLHQALVDALDDLRRQQELQALDA